MSFQALPLHYSVPVCCFFVAASSWIAKLPQLEGIKVPGFPQCPPVCYTYGEKLTVCWAILWHAASCERPEASASRGCQAATKWQMLRCITVACVQKRFVNKVRSPHVVYRDMIDSTRGPEPSDPKVSDFYKTPWEHQKHYFEVFGMEYMAYLNYVHTKDWFCQLW